MTDLLTTDQLSEELEMSVEALAQWRYRGQGPKFVKEGRWIRYRRADVDQWIEDRIHDRTDHPVSGRRAS